MRSSVIILSAVLIGAVPIGPSALAAQTQPRESSVVARSESSDLSSESSKSTEQHKSSKS
jgi:hypothetical protein